MPKIPKLISGPWRRVRNVPDPWDTSTDILADACNGWIPDPDNFSGWFQRPGCSLGPWGNPLVLNAASQRSYTHVTLGGTAYTFVFVGNQGAGAGKVYRLTGVAADGSNWSSAQDVTPAGVTISPTGRITCVSYLGNLVVSDNVNTPWYVPDSGLSATPLAPTKITIDDTNADWAALAGPAIYQGALVFVLGGSTTLGNIMPGVGLAWSEPGQPNVGYNKGGVNDFWNAEQTAERDPRIYAIVGTESGLVFFRRRSIGRASGNPYANFATTATRDAISTSIGCVCQATVQRSDDDTLFWADAAGRAYMLRPSEKPTPIWLDMRAVTDAYLALSGQTNVVPSLGISCIEPTMGLYLYAAHSPNPSTSQPPNELHAFDTRTGYYMGRFRLATGYMIGAIDIVLDNKQRPMLMLQASTSATWPGAGNADMGYCWRMRDIADGVWTDNGVLPSLFTKVGRIGYSTDFLVNFHEGRALTTSTDPVQITEETPYSASDIVATPTPLASAEGVSRAVWGMDTGPVRGIQLTIAPQSVSKQWGIHRVELEGSLSRAGMEDQ